MKFLGPPSSGSIAGTTSSHNRAGQYTRNRRTPVVGTRTPRQSIVKTNLSSSSKAWQALSSVEQANWISYANGHPVVDRLGQSIKLTGAQYFIKCQAALFNVGGPAITTPPVSAAVQPVVLTGFAVSAAGTALAYFQAGSASDYMAWAISKYTSLGVNFQKTFSQGGATAADVNVIDLASYLVPFAGAPLVGTKAWLRLIAVSSYGLTGPAYIAQTPVIATMPITAPVMAPGAPAVATATWATPAGVSDLFTEKGPTSAGPWTMQSVQTAVTSVHNYAGLTTGSFYRCAIYNVALNQFSDWSNAVVIA